MTYNARRTSGLVISAIHSYTFAVNHKPHKTSNMQKYRYENKIRIFILIAIAVLLLSCIILVSFFKTGEEATVGIFSLAITLLGTLFIAVELKNGQDVTCSDMLINLNNYFHDSDRLMNVYETLEKEICSENGSCENSWHDIRGVEIAQYCTFFENLYLLYKHHIAEIEDLDDLFGYRFFIFMHNAYIQEHYILPTSSSYVQIFKLYGAWIAHRKSVYGDKWQKNTPLAHNAFSDSYLKKSVYMTDSLNKESHSETIVTDGQEFVVRELGFEDLSHLLALQDEIVAGLPDKNLYCPLTRAELIESLHLDIAYGVYSPSRELVAFSVIVSPRISDRNLAHGLDGFDESDTITFDAVAVIPEFRGFGLQQNLVKIAKRLAKDCGVHEILTTVSPYNLHSVNNFNKSGFKTHSRVSKYGGLDRLILNYSLLY